jgi:RHS repeat-associated protein
VSFEYFSPYTETTYYNYSDAVTMIDAFDGLVNYTSPVIQPGLGGSATTLPTYIYSGTAPGHITSADPGSVYFPQGYTFPMVTAQSEYHETSYPSKISFPGGEVTFTRTYTSAAGGYKLTKIQVKDKKNSSTIREITFTQTADGGDGELRLTGVTISSGSATPESWFFTYNGSAPPRQTRGIDKWGYYNAAANSTLVPTIITEAVVTSFSDTVTIPGGNREPSEEAMQAGVLSSITYPTGGKAEFTYEAHRYLDSGTNTVKLAGGLRIKSVKETAASGQSHWRHFTYGTSLFRSKSAASGTGLLAVIPYCGTTEADPLELYYRETACHEFEPYYHEHITNYKEHVWTDNSMVSLFSEHGSSVLYPYVMETVSSDSNGNSVTGAMLHHFNITTSHPVKLSGTPLVTDSQDGWSKGEEVSTLTLKGSSSSSTMTDAASQAVGYSLESSQGTIKTGQVYKGHRVYCTDEMYVADQYKAITQVWSLPLLGRKLLTSRSETVIETNGSFTSSESFTYDSYNNVSLHTVTGSKRSGGTAPSRITKYYYPQDVSSSPYTNMVAANMVSVPVKTEEYVNSVSSGNKLSTRETGYKSATVGSGSSSRTIYVPGTESLTVNASASDSNVPSSGTRTVTLGTYDKRGNVMERTGLDGRKEIYLWGYYGHYPVARVRGSTLSSVLATGIDTTKLNTGTQTEISSQLTTLRNAFATNNGVHVETWTWSPLVGMASAVDPSGRTATWTYDGLGRLTGAYSHDGTASRLLENYTYTINQTLPVPTSTSGSGWNSVRTRTMLSTSGTSGAYLEKTSYIDGLARVAEEVTRTSSSSFPSLVTLQEYDGFGRKASTYLPLALASNNSGAYVTPSTAKGRAFMTYSDVYADSYPEYEPTPRDRVTASNGPGSPWRTRSKYVGTQYLVNTTTNGGVYTCSFYEIASATSLKKNGVYAAGELNVVRTTDEDGAVSLVFTDKWGREVLHRRIISGSTYADTYHVYDNLGLLRYVLTPEASKTLTSSSTWNDSNTTLQNQAYIYKYDSRGRRTYSKQPGSAAVYLRYDKADRVTFTQDGVQRSSSLWTFTIPDFLGRECVTGTAAVTSSAITSAATAVPTATFTTASGGTALGGYTSSGITLPSSKTLLSVNYYDGYSFTSTLPSATASRLAVTTLSGYGTAWPSNTAPNAKGLPTGSRRYLVGNGSSYMAESVYYDWKARPIQSHSVDHQGTSADSFMALSFTGNVTASRDVVTPSGGTATVILKTMSYDGWNRLTWESVTVGDGTTTGSVSDDMSYSYDAVGRMTGRTYGNASSTGSTAETLSYDVRDHLTGQSSSVFSSTLYYTDPSRTATTGRYDGSVSEWTWSRGTGSTAQTYAFTYDGLGRLTETRRYTGTGTTATNAFTEKGLAYDRNGNITALTRYGASASSAEDNIAFTLTGNRISSLTNSGTNGSGVTYTSFAYDSNGNTTHDGRTGQDLTWNMLNLISGVSKTAGGTTTQLASYNWYADGSKYSAERSDGTGYVYKGGVIYEKAANGSLTLDCVLTTGGRIVANKNSSGTITGYTVYHHLTDHLGSVRAITNASTGTVVETSDFLPFGTRWSQTSGSSSATITDATNRWRYSGKEEQKAINATIPLIDYGARMYDPTIARWMSVDPMAEKYYYISPYSYCEDNPIIFFDPDGRGPIVGALLGAGLDVVIQISTNAINGEKWYKIDAISVAISAGAGAAGVGVVSKVRKAANLYKISKNVAMSAEVLTEATVSGVESAAKQYTSDRTLSLEETAKDATIGAMSSGAGQIAKHIKRVSGSGELKVLERHYDRVDRVAGKNPRPSRQAKVDQARTAVNNYGDGAKEGAKAITTYLPKTVDAFHENKKKDN